MKIALTGAGEFVAARIIESFHLGAGPSVVAVAQHPSELTASARFALELRLASFLDIPSLARSFAGCSAVVHVARLAAHEMKRASSVLCRAAAQAGARRLVFLSTADVHGLCPAPGTTEKSPLPAQPVSEMHRALIVAERQFFTECRQLGLTGHALRAGYLYGPRTRSVAELATSLLAGTARLHQRGEGICNSLYVDNLVTAVRLALKARSAAGVPFLLTDAETLTWREFYQAAAQELRVSPRSIQIMDEPIVGRELELTAEPAAAPEPPTSAEMTARQQCTWKLPTARAAAELGYAATVPFAEAMRRSIAWWRFAQGEFFAAA